MSRQQDAADLPDVSAEMHMTAASQAGSDISSSETSDQSPSAFQKDIGELQDDVASGMSQEFSDWTYKNVGLLGERNREMAEQAAELRSIGSFREEKPTDKE